MMKSEEADMMTGQILGISILTMGVWQLFTARKMYYNIKKNVKKPIPYMFIGVYVSVALGIGFVLGGLSLIF